MGINQDYLTFDLSSGYRSCSFIVFLYSILWFLNTPFFTLSFFQTWEDDKDVVFEWRANLLLPVMFYKYVV